MTLRSLWLCLLLLAVPVVTAEPTERDRALSRLHDIQRKFYNLLDIPGVEGIAIVPDKDPHFIIYLSAMFRSEELLPKTFDGYEVRRVVTGEFQAFAGAQMGTSTGNGDACVAGTLGIAVKDRSDGRQGYITNAHVATADEVDSCPGANVRPQVAPSRRDIPNCGASTRIGTLERASVIPHDGVTLATVDAAFVIEKAGTVDPANACGICPSDLSLITPANAVGMNVRKCGRSNTNHSPSTKPVGPVSGVIWVRYPCNRLVMFENQIVVEGAGFAKRGDSGSVVYGETKGVVGLLFAGNGQLTLLNPIQEVLDELKVDIDTARHCH